MTEFKDDQAYQKAKAEFIAKLKKIMVILPNKDSQNPTFAELLIDFIQQSKWVKN